MLLLKADILPEQMEAERLRHGSRPSGDTFISYTESSPFEAEILRRIHESLLVAIKAYSCIKEMDAFGNQCRIFRFSAALLAAGVGETVECAETVGRIPVQRRTSGQNKRRTQSDFNRSL